MSFVIYHKETTVLHTNRRRDRWKTEASAKAERTRSKLDPDTYLIEDAPTFFNTIEKTKVVKSLMSGKPVTIPVNTPGHCDPSTERYWSM